MIHKLKVRGQANVLTTLIISAAVIAIGLGIWAYINSISAQQSLQAQIRGVLTEEALRDKLTIVHMYANQSTNTIYIYMVVGFISGNLRDYYFTIRVYNMSANPYANPRYIYMALPGNETYYNCTVWTFSITDSGEYVPQANITPVAITTEVYDENLNPIPRYPMYVYNASYYVVPASYIGGEAGGLILLEITGLNLSYKYMIVIDSLLPIGTNLYRYKYYVITYP